MVERYADHTGIVHFMGIFGGDYTLCGDALEGEKGDTPMAKTREKVDCENCKGVVAYCKAIGKTEILQPGEW